MYPNIFHNVHQQLPELVKISVQQLLHFSKINLPAIARISKIGPQQLLHFSKINLPAIARISKNKCTATVSI